MEEVSPFASQAVYNVANASLCLRQGSNAPVARRIIMLAESGVLDTRELAWQAVQNIRAASDCGRTSVTAARSYIPLMRKKVRARLADYPHTREQSGAAGYCLGAGPEVRDRRSDRILKDHRP
jgi:hypothetical protein